jgi:hypothetical protein
LTGNKRFNGKLHNGNRACSSARNAPDRDASALVEVAWTGLETATYMKPIAAIAVVIQLSNTCLALENAILN